jgi:hypothetical protein
LYEKSDYIGKKWLTPFFSTFTFVPTKGGKSAMAKKAAAKKAPAKKATAKKTTKKK